MPVTVTFIGTDSKGTFGSHIWIIPYPLKIFNNTDNIKQMFKYCPSCGSPKIRFERNKVFHCPDCGFSYYHNTAAATACVISDGRVPAEEHILFLVRARDPGKGKLDLPGGFVDPGEGAIESLRRELREELGWEPAGEPVLFASFPNIYPYKNIVYNTCDLFFTLSAPELADRALTTLINIEESEVREIRFLRYSEIDAGDIAFESVKKALAAYAARQTGSR
jgi:ADP-ribose pyrophosphatase YjhB (NUDIX family)